MSIVCDIKYVFLKSLKDINDIDVWHCFQIQNIRNYIKNIF